MYFLHIIFVILMLLTLAGTFTDFKHKPYYTLFYWGFVLLFFTLSFLRWERGADWEAYYGFFSDNIPPSPDLSFEMGYQWLSYIISQNIGSYTLLLFIQGAIIAFCTGWVIKRYSCNAMLSMFVFFAISFAGIYFVRQYVAIAVTMFSFHFIVRRKFWPFVLLIFLAAQFHVTAWIFVFAYPIYIIKLSNKAAIIILLISFAFSLLLMQSLLSMLGDMGGFVAIKINQYLEMGSDPTLTGAAEGTSLQLLLIKGFAQRSFIFALIFVLLSKMRLQSNELNGIVNFYLFGVILFAVLAPLSIVLARAVNYYEYFIILLIPYFIESINIRFNRVVLLFVITAYLFVRFTSSYNQYPKRFAPYKSIFDKEAPIYME